MSYAESLESLQAKRKSLEEKAKTLEEKAREEKLAIDRKLVIEILEEENRTHADAVRELEEKIANLQKQTKTPPQTESIPTQAASEPSEDTSDETEDNVSESILLQPEQGEVEALPERSKKKKRGLF